ncbi:hypothetical protein [Rhodopirellula baltica]|uniref:Uncharacterized protein n=2 Tax=Rhodopirellula baltica TaxID=265606 RepID=Q7UNL8_RHOBA|nr:hypothetical protein [Rhodopirellula baltica]CAD75400.1 hypothetical protein-signal peptide and transmembrane prediction [Rhodopirellula baltica SH 1]
MPSESVQTHMTSSDDSKLPSSLLARLLAPRNLAVFVFLVLPLSLIFLVLIWWFARQNIAAQELADRKNDLLASGLPIDAESLLDYRRERIDSSRSQEWQRILDEIESDAFQESGEDVPIIGLAYEEEPEEYVYGQPYSNHLIARDYLSEWSGLLQRIHLITEGSRGVWTPMTTYDLFPRIGPTRDVSRLLRLEFDDALRRDDFDHANHCVLALIGNSRALEEEPMAVSQLVSVAILEFALDAIKTALQIDCFDDEQWRAVLEQLEGLEEIEPRYRRFLIGERAWVLPLFQDQTSMEELGGDTIEYQLPGGHSIDALETLAMYDRLELVPTDDLTTFFEEIESLETLVQASFQSRSWLRKLDTQITEVTMPSLVLMNQAFVRSAMHVRLAKTAILARLFQHREGRWPSTIQEIHDAAPGLLSSGDENGNLTIGSLAPMGDRPFGLKVDQDELVLWGFEPDSVTAATPVDPPTEQDFIDADAEYAPMLADSYLQRWLWNLPTDGLAKSD